jgi:transposase
MGRKRYKKILKAQITLDAIKDQKTIAELASEYGVHANQISIWKNHSFYATPVAFSNGKDKDAEKKRGSARSFVSKSGPTENTSRLAKKRQAIWNECFRESHMHRQQ